MAKHSSESISHTSRAMEDPDFIIYLLDPAQEYNCYFVVGNPDVKNVERIGVVKKMLLAHSPVLRAELQDSKIAEKKDVKVIDIFPQTFKHLLRFVYGFDNTEHLDFDEADNLLYVAEKYMIPKLKNRLATRLISLLDCNNICSLMNNPACCTVLELNSAISEILQSETDGVLASPQFMDLSSSGFLKILEQEICNVAEVDLWRAAIKWAKNRGKSEEGSVLRKELTEHVQHIRFCSMTNEELIKEILPTRVLTYDEFIMVGESCSTGKVQPHLTTVCNVIEKRKLPAVKSELLHLSLNGSENAIRITDSTLKLNTKDTPIELCSVELYCKNLSSHQCNCTISIQRETEPSTVIRFNGHIDSAFGFTIPICNDGKYVQLLPTSSYSFKIIFSCSVPHFGLYTRSSQQHATDFSVDFEYHPKGDTIFHVHKICYKTVTRRVKKSARLVQ